MFKKKHNLNLDLNYKCTLDYVIYIPLDARRPERLSITLLIPLFDILGFLEDFYVCSLLRIFFGHICFIIYLPYKR